jgi:pilus assembly protein Flp/PilA
MFFIKNLLKNQNGATAIEYGLIAALIVVGSMFGLSKMATNQKNSFDNMSTAVVQVMK